MEQADREVMEMQIEQALSQVKSLQDLVAQVNKMRAEGFPIILLNKYSSKRRKELAAEASDIKIVPKKSVDMLMSTKPIALAQISLDHAADPNVVIGKTGLFSI